MNPRRFLLGHVVGIVFGVAAAAAAVGTALLAASGAGTTALLRAGALTTVLTAFAVLFWLRPLGDQTDRR